MTRTYSSEDGRTRLFVMDLENPAIHPDGLMDDVVRMFIQWIDMYSEPHFAVIREVFKSPGCTRQQIWQTIHGADVREDSAEADLFKLLVHDLSTGHVIRQHREKDYYGNFIKREPQRRGRGEASRVMASAFDDDKQYEPHWKRPRPPGSSRIGQFWIQTNKSVLDTI
jgi:hypothetical protein